MEPETGIASDDEPTIRLEYRPTLRDQLAAAAWAGRRSDVAFAIGFAALALVVPAILTGNPVAAAFQLLFGGLLITGLLGVPFVWWAARQRPSVVGAPFVDVIDRSGIHETSPLVTAEIPWSTYADVTETRHAFYLATAGGGVGSLPKRAFSDADLEAFRRLVGELQLRRRPRRLRRLLVLVAVLGIGATLVAGAVLLSRLNVSPRIDLAPVVEGRQVHVHVTTDLPDEALVAIELIQFDEFTRSLAEGAPNSADSPWVRYRYALVEGGRIDVALDASGWPPGRHRVVVFFSMTLQPPEVVERYGKLGERLSGPNVRRGDDGRRVEVWTEVVVP